MCTLFSKLIGTRLSYHALGSTLIALGAAMQAPAQAQDKVKIFSGTDEHWVQLQVAKARRFFAEEGLDAELTVFTTGATATEAFRAGRGDFISAGDLPSAAMWKSGAAIGIAPMSSDTEIFGIVGKSELNSPSDLRGRKVATRMGSTGEFLLYRYLARGGLSPKDVNIIDLAPPEMVISMVHGDIDAFAWLAPFTTRAINTGKNVKLITNAKGLANNRIIMSVTPSFRDKNPEAVRKVLRAMHRGTEFVRTNPEEATKIWAAAVQGDPKQSLPVVRLIDYDMTFSSGFVADMNELAKFMVQKGALKEAINWEKEMDTSFLRSVNPKLVAATPGK
jgi:ABC-type nitrate/sulfonate/bicarbonate transport system substrate-binding protein